MGLMKLSLKLKFGIPEVNEIRDFTSVDSSGEWMNVWEFPFASAVLDSCLGSRNLQIMEETGGVKELIIAR